MMEKEYFDEFTCLEYDIVFGDYYTRKLAILEKNILIMRKGLKHMRS